MVTIQAFNTYDQDVLEQVIVGYVSSQKYQITWEDTPEHSSFRLELVTLPTPYVKHYEVEPREYYEPIVHAGLSLVMYDDDQPITLAIASTQAWNQAFWIHEFHVAKAYQGRGIGRQLMNALIAKAHATESRTMVCETQNTNVPAIRFYRKLGFRLEALDISLYTNDDLTNGEVALFMKRRL